MEHVLKETMRIEMSGKAPSLTGTGEVDPQPLTESVASMFDYGCSTRVAMVAMLIKGDIFVNVTATRSNLLWGT